MAADDGGNPSLRDTTYVEVTVIRESGEFGFTLPSYEITISENLPIGRSVITTQAQPGVSS